MNLHPLVDPPRLFGNLIIGTCFLIRTNVDIFNRDLKKKDFEFVQHFKQKMNSIYIN